MRHSHPKTSSQADVLRHEELALQLLVPLVTNKRRLVVDSAGKALPEL